MNILRQNFQHVFARFHCWFMQLKDAQKINPHTINVARVLLFALINAPQRPTKSSVISKWCIAVTISPFAKAESVLHILPYKQLDTTIRKFWKEQVSQMRAGPSPGFSSRGGQKPAGGAKSQKGGHIFKMQYWMYAATGGPNVKWGGRAPLAPPLATALNAGRLLQTSY